MVEVKTGFFVEAIHDLYAGINLYGPFDDKEKINTDELKGGLPFFPDEVNIVELPYIELEGEVYPIYVKAMAIPTAS